MKIEYYEESTKIIECYRISKYEISNIITNIVYYRLRKYLPVNRSYKSYERELKVHIKLYKLGLFKEHTKDCDLEENIKWYYELLYLILGW